MGGMKYILNALMCACGISVLESMQLNSGVYEGDVLRILA